MKLSKILGKQEVDKLKKDAKNGVIPLLSAITEAGLPQHDEDPISEEKLTNAKIYFQLLNQKMHKLFSKINRIKSDVKQKQIIEKVKRNCKLGRKREQKMLKQYRTEQEIDEIGLKTQPETRLQNSEQNTDTVSIVECRETTESQQTENQDSIYSQSQLPADRAIKLME